MNVVLLAFVAKKAKTNNGMRNGPSTDPSVLK
jgi:hypothetical protein